MTTARWELYEHEADIGVRGFGASPAEAFKQAAVALAAVVTEPASIIQKQFVQLDCEADDLELLFVDWLNALIYEMAIRKMLFSRFEIQIDGVRLHASAWGERVEPARHCPAVEPKGATYTDLHVRQQTDGTWVAQCVVDV